MFIKFLDKYVLTQSAIILAIALSTPFVHIKAPTWIHYIGILLLIAGLIIMLISGKQLGAALSPAITPNPNAQLITTGIYSIVRHPMYCGVIMLVIGWSLFRGSLLSLFFSI